MPIASTTPGPDGPFSMVKDQYFDLTDIRTSMTLNNLKMFVLDSY